MPQMRREDAYFEIKQHTLYVTFTNAGNSAQTTNFKYSNCLKATKTSIIFIFRTCEIKNQATEMVHSCVINNWENVELVVAKEYLTKHNLPLLIGCKDGSQKKSRLKSNS